MLPSLHCTSLSVNHLLREEAAERQPPPSAWRSFLTPRFERGELGMQPVNVGD
jgi:hypothetical protein